MLLIMGVIMCAAVLGQYRWRPPLPLAVSFTLFIAGGIVLVPAVALVAWDIRERKAADDALALYLQIREHERATWTRVLPWMRIHPDFHDTDPLGGRAPADTAYLERGLRQRTVGVLWAAAAVSAVICGGSVIVASDLPSWVLVVPLLGSLVFVPPCARAIAIYRGAKTYLLGLIHDEWKAKERVLPAGFPVPPRFERLRDAATLPAAYPRRIAAAIRLGWSAEFFPLVLLSGVLFAWMIPYALHVPWPFALTILVLAMAATGVFWWWLEDGRALRDSLLEYEQVTDVTLAEAEPRR